MEPENVNTGGCVYDTADGVVAAGLYFDSYLSVHIPGGDRAVAQRVLELSERYNRIFSPTGTDEREPETAELAARAVQYCGMTGGAFDAYYSGRLDLGGVAKGYIADRIAHLLRDEGITSAMIDLGGNVFALGSRPDGVAWRVGIQDPFDEEKGAIRALSVRDCAVVTSGVYRRGAHIIDPRCGLAASAELISATVICRDAEPADALATACIVLGMDEAMKLIEGLPATEAVFIDKEGNIKVTGGLRNV